MRNHTWYWTGAGIWRYQYMDLPAAVPTQYCVQQFKLPVNQVCAECIHASFFSTHPTNTMVGTYPSLPYADMYKSNALYCRQRTHEVDNWNYDSSHLHQMGWSGFKTYLINFRHGGDKTSDKQKQTIMRKFDFCNRNPCRLWHSLISVLFDKCTMKCIKICFIQSPPKTYLMLLYLFHFFFNPYVHNTCQADISNIRKVHSFTPKPMKNNINTIQNPLLHAFSFFRESGSLPLELASVSFPFKLASISFSPSSAPLLSSLMVLSGLMVPRTVEAWLRATLASVMAASHWARWDSILLRWLISTCSLAWVLVSSCFTLFTAASWLLRLALVAPASTHTHTHTHACAHAHIYTQTHTHTNTSTHTEINIINLFTFLSITWMITEIHEEPGTRHSELRRVTTLVRFLHIEGFRPEWYISTISL